jgi:hypothetical protein
MIMFYQRVWNNTALVSELMLSLPNSAFGAAIFCKGLYFDVSSPSIYYAFIYMTGSVNNFYYAIVDLPNSIISLRLLSHFSGSSSNDMTYAIFKDPNNAFYI